MKINVNMEKLNQCTNAQLRSKIGVLVKHCKTSCKNYTKIYLYNHCKTCENKANETTIRNELYSRYKPIKERVK